MADVIMGTTRSRTRITREGEFEEYYEVEFFIDDARYTLEMSPVGFTAKAAEEAVRKKAAELVAVKGKKIAL
ncbi:unnamed protein product [marine sediment metagenome]|uniref:Uncharacterized protein n=1 Tax=marine sediment metagenome TaxID=412755 RepID=X1KWI2_9ZZZZ